MRWSSSGEGSYTIENVERAERGTEIVLHLREDEKEFLDVAAAQHHRQVFRSHCDPVEMLNRSSRQMR